MEIAFSMRQKKEKRKTLSLLCFTSVFIIAVKCYILSNTSVTNLWQTFPKTFKYIPVHFALLEGNISESNVSASLPSVTYITVEMKGRLGNNMFQYAAMLASAFRTGKRPVLTSKFAQLKEAFKLSLNISRHVNRLKNEKVISELDMRSRPDLVKKEIDNSKDLPMNITLLGYFQTMYYFEEIQQRIRKEFTFHDRILAKVRKFFAASTPTNHTDLVKIGVHVRRTDMLRKDLVKDGFGPPKVSYYRKAMQYFRTKHKHVVFVVCSDDPAWVKENLLANDVIVAEKNSASVDLAILSSCDHVIFAVGTFGWWAGWLCPGIKVTYKGFPKPNTKSNRLIPPEFYWPQNDTRYIVMDE